MKHKFNQPYLVIIFSCMRTDRERQTITIYNRHDFAAFSSTSGNCPRRRPSPLQRSRSIKLSSSSSTRAKFMAMFSQNSAQNLALTPSLKPAMHRFVIRITLRQHVPLRPVFKIAERRFKDFPRRNRLPTRAPLRNVLFRKMMPDTLNPRSAVDRFQHL